MMIRKPRGLVQAKDNLILEKERLVDEICDLENQISNTTDEESKAVLNKELESKQLELGRIAQKLF